MFCLLVENGNDGTINGECYFNGRAKHGTFIPYESAQPLSDSMLPQTYNNYYNDPSNAPNIEFVCDTYHHQSSKIAVRKQRKRF